MPPNKTRIDDDARAPYNFISLNSRILAVTEQEGLEDLDRALPDHDVFDPARKTGYFAVTLTSESPLYIRGMLTDEELKRLNDTNASEEEKRRLKNKAEFFQLDDGKPRIPASSLRGLIRSLVEIVTFGKMGRVSDSRLFYRDLRDKDYQSRIVKPLGTINNPPNPAANGYQARVRGGFIRRQRNGWVIDECIITRVETRDIVNMFGLSRTDDLYELNGSSLNQHTRNNPNQTPRWAYQHHDIWLDVGEEDDHFFPEKHNQQGRLIHPNFYLRFRKGSNPSAQPNPHKSLGILVQTGRMARKHLEFVFVPVDKPTQYDIPNDPREVDINKRLVDQFQSEFQLTTWQQDAFPKDKPAPNSRQEAGFLRDGDPVFFLVRDDCPTEVLFFGRAQMFRLPYRNSPKNLIERQQKLQDNSINAQIDFADAIFGFVPPDKSTQHKQGDKQAAYAGRVFFSDATLIEAPNGLYDTDEPIIPPILSTPKPTTYQHYLEPDENNKGRHYDAPHAKVRGRKLYWRAKLETTAAIHQDGINLANSRQHTQLQAVKPEVMFEFQVHFENLTSVELGALAWALALPDIPNGRHMMGMGKPFGMGIVKLKPKLWLNNRMERYKTLIKDDQWVTGYYLADKEMEIAIRSFTDFVAEKIGQPFTEIPSICELSAMLSQRSRYLENIEGRRIDPLFDYQVIHSERDINDFYGRPVLPKALQVAAKDEERVRVEEIAKKQEEQQRQEKEQLEELRKTGYKRGMRINGVVTHFTEDNAVIFDVVGDQLPGKRIGIIYSSDRGNHVYKIQERFLAEIIEVELDDENNVEILWCRRVKRPKKD